MGISPSTDSRRGVSWGVYGLELLALTKLETNAISSSKDALTAFAIDDDIVIPGTLRAILSLEGSFSNCSVKFIE
ncbi:MAG: hypothetical protein UX62_C0042G0006 [Microgenomates group bacterium GW2011_GWA2_46_7]|nr:MAG: hypothetical protein UX62_C0042G0006 [Microgenomates group bacterium GW2011_GWA2_46_7]